MKKTIALLCMLALFSFALAGCGADSGSGDGAGNFVIGSNGALTAGLDPAADYEGWETVRWGIGETLFVLDGAMTPQPFLASDYKVSENQLTWTITINDGITFHNGNAVDGAAVKASLERVVEKNERANKDLQIAKIEADGQKVMITTTEPNATFINSLCDPYACIVDAISDTSGYEEAPIGTGPYKVQSYTQGEKLVVERNERYWNGTPKMNTITVKSITDASTLSSALQSGEINAAYGIPYSDLGTFENSDSYIVSQAATSRVFMLYFNFNDEFMKDIQLRKAISMAIDKKSLGEVVLAGAGTATQAAFPSYLSYGDDSLMTDAQPYDVEGAKALLAASGYTDANGDGILEKDGKDVSLRMVTYGRTGLPEQAEAVQSALNSLGLNVSFKQYEAVEDVLKAGDYSLCAYAYVTTPTGDPLSYLNYTMGTGQGSNFGKYSNAKIDDLLSKLAVEFDREKRSGLAVEIQQLALKDAAYCYMTHLNMALVMQSNVVGIEQSPADYYIVTVDTGFAQ